MVYLFLRMEQKVKVNKKIKGLYSNNAMRLSAFLGGPFVAGFMAGENYKEMGFAKKSRLVKWLGVGFTALVFILPNLLTSLNAVPSGGDLRGIGFLGALIGLVLINFQAKDVKQQLESGTKKRIGWPTICIVFVLGYIGLVVLSTIV